MDNNKPSAFLVRPLYKLATCNYKKIENMLLECGMFNMKCLEVDCLLSSKRSWDVRNPIAGRTPDRVHISAEFLEGSRKTFAGWFVNLIPCKPNCHRNMCHASSSCVSCGDNVSTKHLFTDYPLLLPVNERIHSLLSKLCVT